MTACTRSNASPVADWSVSSSATQPRARSDDTVSYGPKCLAAKLDLPVPDAPTRMTRANSGISILLTA
jgi:hypothetical protein